MSELIVALDGMAPDNALQVAGDLSHLQPNGLWGFKIGHSLIFAGAEWIAELKKFGKSRYTRSKSSSPCFSGASVLA